MATKWTLCLLALPMLVIQTEAALSIGAFADTNMADRIKDLRSSIFVETAFLEERPADISCSSLDGPSCLNAMLTEGHVLDGPGVIPERLLHDLGEGPGEFATPEYWSLESLLGSHPIHNVAPLLTGEEARDYFANGRNNTSTGILHFAGALLDRKLPLTFSNGLPNDVVATWDGRWIARDCSFAGKPASLPAPGELALTPSSRAVGQPGQLSISVELAGSLGYLRFSHPVSVRSLFVHWTVDPNAPRALVAGRLGLESVWSSHLDPQQLDFAKGWIDVSGDPLAQVDELVFMAAKGLQIGAIQIATVDGIEDQERTVLLLRPVSQDEEETTPRFVPLLQKLRADATPFIASIQEVVDNNLRLRLSTPPRALGGPRGETVPGLLSSQTLVHEEKLTEESLKFRLAASQNAELFAHGFLSDVAVDARDMLAGFASVPAGVLPEDLRRQLSMEAPDLAQTIQQHVRAGGWKRSTPLRLPNEGSDEAVQKYMTAKRQQISFDLVSAALMYITHNSGF
mgnify:FL=1